jgi:Family of unknown function (DUF6298)/Putative collagen-binding domain of a collagenase
MSSSTPSSPSAQPAKLKRPAKFFWLWLVILAGLVVGASGIFYLLVKPDRWQRLLQQARTQYVWLRPRYDPLVADSQASRVAEQLLVTQPAPATGPLRALPNNSHYFTDGSGQAIYLTGSHTWSDLQDTGLGDPPSVFDYPAFLDFLVAHHHNFMRLYTQEQSAWGGWLTAEIRFTPHPYLRTGPGLALDGKPKFDLNQFDPSYFDRLYERVEAAQARGLYVAVMLFNGWSNDSKDLLGNAWPGHPFNAANNINGVDGDLNHDGEGNEIHTGQSSELTARQEAYARKLIHTVNGLDNVLYEISNESNGDSTEWQYHFIRYIKEYEATLPQQHPVGMTVQYIMPEGDNAALFKSPADWVSPARTGGYDEDPPLKNFGKVIIADTDHIFGIGGDRQWVWKSFTRGLNPIFMDPYTCSPTWPPLDVCDPNNPVWVSLRNNLGYTRSFAQRMNLAAMTPSYGLASTGFCLANAVAQGAEYLVYAPTGGEFRVDVSAAHSELQVEWFNPEQGDILRGPPIQGGAIRTFTPPFAGDAVLYLHQ